MTHLPSVDLVVSVDDDHLESLAEVADRLCAAGMQVEAVHDALGTVTGRAPEALLPLLRAVPGVASVEPDRPVRMA